MKKKKNLIEKEREITFCVWERYVQNGKENCKFIVKGGE